jgi:hypothetical protein
VVEVHVTGVCGTPGPHAQASSRRGRGSMSSSAFSRFSSSIRGRVGSFLQAAARYAAGMYWPGEKQQRVRTWVGESSHKLPSV